MLKHLLHTTSALLLSAAFISLSFQQSCAQQVILPDAPSATLVAASAPEKANTYATLNLDPIEALFGSESSSAGSGLDQSAQTSAAQKEAAQQHHEGPCPKPAPGVELDANCNPIPIDRQQPKRILGFMPNFRSVSAGARPIPPGWKQNFKVATRQAFDFSSFIFLGLTSISAEGINEHKAFGKGVGGFYTYTWHGFLDKTDGTYIGAFFLPSLLHEDTRYYAVGRGSGHSYAYRIMYVASRQVITRTYGGHATPNIAGLGGKVLTQIISRTYYPANSATFGVLAEKFAYSSMRDMIFTGIREFYPDAAGQYSKKHQRKAAAMASRDAAAAAASQSTTNPTGTPLPKP